MARAASVVQLARSSILTRDRLRLLNSQETGILLQEKSAARKRSRQSMAIGVMEGGQPISDSVLRLTKFMPRQSACM